MTTIEIGGRQIGTSHAPFVIAEISANHHGSLETAIELIGAAAAAGADAVKFQHYRPETITVRSDHPDFEVRGGTLWDGRQLADLYAEAMTPWEWTSELAAAAASRGVIWFSSPFDRTAIDHLVDHGVPALKIASFELVDLPLIRYAASTGVPLVISTGMATRSEIDDAVAAAGDAKLALLRCNSGYPADPAEMDLAAITAMRDRWDVPVGLSDHTRTSTAAIAATALGACIIEKHLTMNRSHGGPDDDFSAEPEEFRQLVGAVREAHAAVGSERFGPSTRERASLGFRRSLRIVRPVQAGAVIEAEDVRSIRPAGGMPPDEIGRVVGARATRDLAVGDPVLTTDLQQEVGRDENGPTT